jgi:tetratricopeptide (TPR) repeat protein
MKGDIPAATAAGNAALKLSTELAESDPRDAQSGVTIIEDYKLVADLESRTGRGRDASIHMEKAFALMPKLVAQSPNDTEVQAMKADLNTTAGDIASRTRNYQRALRYYGTSIGVLSAVVSANTKNGGAGQRLGATHNSAGRAQLGLHNLETAEASFKKAVSLVNEAAQASHPNMQALYTIADAYTGLGDVEASRASDPQRKQDGGEQHWQQSATWYRQSAEVWRRVPEVGRVSTDVFDCVPPAAVARRLSQAEANVEKVSGATP